jgi:hypothetical protein
MVNIARVLPLCWRARPAEKAVIVEYSARKTVVVEVKLAAAGLFDVALRVKPC